MTSNLKVVREELIKKFDGLPLVARVFGKAVQFRGDYDGWVTILESVARTPFQLHDGNFALSILKLSVDRLPSSSLKQCFAYCSNFPKDFNFEKEKLIQMWVAQGFILPQEGRSSVTMEDIGDAYFNILLSRCLFQDVIKDDRGRLISCKMHDLIHDIACIVSNGQELQDSRNLWMTNETEKMASKVRTIIFHKEMFERIDKVICDKIVNCVSLRVLIMNSRNIVELPDSIGKLKHLRYLDISNCSIWILPKSIASLYNLQTLRMEYSPIMDLPENLRELVSLRHLEFSTLHFNGIEKMPSHLSQLIQLQTLSYFVAGFQKGCQVTELGHLKNLKGDLQLLKLEEVKNREEATSAKLVEKENLSGLDFNWSILDQRKHNHHNDLEVLEGLEPHQNPRSLGIRGFAGKIFPNNIFVSNLVEINLKSCINCEMLPMLGQLANLEELRIVGLHGVRSIGNEFYRNESNQRTFFPRLRIFRLEMMTDLEQWDEVTVASNITIFPRLQMLNIVWCENLLKIPDVFGYDDENGVKQLKDLEINECHQLTKLPNGLQFCHSIQNLSIGNSWEVTPRWQNMYMLSQFPNLNSLKTFNFPGLPELAPFANLKLLKITGRMQDYDWSPLVHLPSLIRLSLHDVSGIATSLPQELEHLVTLEILSICDFDGIEILPECLGNLVSLQILDLYGCKNLKQFPPKEVMRRLTKLRLLNILNCPQLLYDRNDQEWVKVSHIPTIQVHTDEFHRERRGA